MALTDQLVAYYKLDESSGNPVDSSGNGYTLTNNNTVAFATGKINNGADFGSANSSKWFNNNGLHGFTSALNAVSLSCWVNITTAPGTGEVQQFVQSFIGEVSGGDWKIFYLDAAGVKKLYIQNDGGGFISIQHNINNWHMVSSSSYI